MIDSALLDRYAAVFAVLSALQLSPATDAAVGRVVNALDEWPLTADAVATPPDPFDAGGEAPGARWDTAWARRATGYGLTQLRASVERGETAAVRRHDQDLMYGISATAKVPPYESVHRSTDHLVFNLETLEVRAKYRVLDLEAPKLNNEPDDHIGLEFDFLCQCILRALDGETESEQQRPLAVALGFTRDNLLRWAPRMLTSAASQAETAWLTGLEWASLGAILDWTAALERENLLQLDWRGLPVRSRIRDAFSAEAAQ